MLENEKEQEKSDDAFSLKSDIESGLLTTLKEKQQTNQAHNIKKKRDLLLAQMYTFTASGPALLLLLAFNCSDVTLRDE